MKELNIANFEEEVSKAKLAVIDFWAPWCGPCRMQGPILEDFAMDRPDVSVFKVNVDSEPALAKAFGVMSIPTLVIYKDGKMINKAVGLHSAEDIEDLLG